MHSREANESYGDTGSHGEDVEPGNENAPLLDEQNEAAASPDRELSIARLLALTCINGGLQVFFSTVMANLSVRPAISYTENRCVVLMQ